MKNTIKMALVIASVAASISANAVFISQNTDNNTIVANNSVSCNAGGLHTDNWYARAFTLASFGITQPFQVSSLRMGVELANAQSGTQNVKVNIYDGFTTAGSIMTPGALVGSNTVSLGNGSNFFVTVSVTGLITSGKVVAEVFTPDGQTLGNSFFIGSNDFGQSGPSYIKAPACGINNLQTLSSIGFPGMHELIALNGTAVPEPGSIAALGLGAIALIRRRKA